MILILILISQYPLEWLPNLESNSHTSWKLWGGLGIGVS